MVIKVRDASLANLHSWFRLKIYNLLETQSRFAEKEVIVQFYTKQGMVFAICGS